jgi:hypothetical protein
VLSTVSSPFLSSFVSAVRLLAMSLSLALPCCRSIGLLRYSGSTWRVQKGGQLSLYPERRGASVEAYLLEDPVIPLGVLDLDVRPVRIRVDHLLLPLAGGRHGEARRGDVKVGRGECEAKGRVWTGGDCRAGLTACRTVVQSP